ncbi:unnamed protein product [Citrullus colocynthis]|uniref:Uncharacterized protein n=1 Tax=Citrullus colocynthis TaxID=252529 RepID=A0ABP0YXD0_9ROSI
MFLGADYLPLAMTLLERFRLEVLVTLPCIEGANLSVLLKDLVKDVGLVKPQASQFLDSDRVQEINNSSQVQWLTLACIVACLLVPGGALVGLSSLLFSIAYISDSQENVMRCWMWWIVFIANITPGRVVFLGLTSGVLYLIYMNHPWYINMADWQ